ncbi:MAG TPA: hypothetical protein VF082_12745 [Jiangellaceae bacterium]
MRVNILGFPTEAGHLVSLLRGLVDSVEVVGQHGDVSGELVMLSLEVTVMLPWMAIERPDGELDRWTVRKALLAQTAPPGTSVPPEAATRRPRRIVGNGGRA